MQVAPLERKLRVGRGHTEGRREHLVVERERDLCHRCGASGGLEVTDVALHAPEGGAIVCLTDDIDQ